MTRETIVVTTTYQYGGNRSLFESKDKAVEYAQQLVTDPEVRSVEVRAYNTLDLVNYALDDLADAAEEDPEVENGELIATFE